MPVRAIGERSTRLDMANLPSESRASLQLPTHKPMIGLAPRVGQGPVNFLSCQQCTAARDVATDELNDGLVRKLPRWQVGKRFAARVFRRFAHTFRRDELHESPTLRKYKIETSIARESSLG